MNRSNNDSLSNPELRTQMPRLEDGPRLDIIAGKLLLKSGRDISYSYRGLTVEERACGTEDEYARLIARSYRVVMQEDPDFFKREKFDKGEIAVLNILREKFEQGRY